MKIKLSKEKRNLNFAVLTGLVGGLFVYWAQIATQEVIKNLGLPNSYGVTIPVSLGIGLFIFVIFALTERK
jgi:hypothetical protein